VLPGSHGPESCGCTAGLWREQVVDFLGNKLWSATEQAVECHGTSCGVPRNTLWTCCGLQDNMWTRRKQLWISNPQLSREVPPCIAVRLRGGVEICLAIALHA
jgi:hypothetical protein